MTEHIEIYGCDFWTIQITYSTFPKKSFRTRPKYKNLCVLHFIYYFLYTHKNVYIVMNTLKEIIFTEFLMRAFDGRLLGDYEKILIKQLRLSRNRNHPAQTN